MKYIFFGYLLLAVMIIYGATKLIEIKIQLEKRVAGIATEIEEINEYREEISEL